jgi:hypothetical protein
VGLPVVKVEDGPYPEWYYKGIRITYEELHTYQHWQSRPLKNGWRGDATETLAEMKRAIDRFKAT